MADDARWQQRYDKKLAEAFELHAKLHDVLLELKRMQSGENPVRDVMVFYDELWVSLYAAGSKDAHYEFNRTIDPAQIKRLLKTMDVLTLKGRITRYFADREPFLMRNKHPFNLFLSRMNVYVPASGVRAGSADDEPGPPPPDCQHTPRCKTDIQHTKTKARELRA